MTKVTSEGQEIYTWESDVGSLETGVFMDAQVTFEQFMFAMGIDEEEDIAAIRARCEELKAETEAELKEPAGVVIQVRSADDGLDISVGSFVQ